MSTVTIGRVENTALRVLSAISLCHLLNDLVQSVIPAVYPILKNSYGLDFGQIGLITLTFQVTASILQPVIGTYTDAHPTPNSLPVGMAFTLCGTLLLAAAPSYAVILVAVALVGMGSAVFHPESSRVARVASGGRHGLAQSFFQVGGNAGSALGPLMAAFIVLPSGQRSIAWFSILAVIGMLILTRVSRWYKRHQLAKSTGRVQHRDAASRLPRAQVRLALAVLV